MRAPNKFYSIFIRAIGCIVLGVFVFFMISFGGSSSKVLKTYTSLSANRNVSTIAKKFTFVAKYTYATGDITFAQAAGFTKDEAEVMQTLGTLNSSDSSSGGGSDDSTSSGSGTPGSVSSHGHVAYRQNKYSESIVSGKCTISGGGCGWCSMSAAMAALNPDKCASMTPVDWLSVMDDTVKNGWSGGCMSWAAPGLWISYINNMSGNPYGKYTITQVNLGGTESTAGYLNIVKQNAGNPNKVVVISSSTGLFTTGGHIICVVDYTSDGFMHIADSSNLAGSRLGVKWEEFSSLDLPTDVTNCNGYSYAWKQAWIVERNN